ncbi:MAG: HD domain-containing protein, partial [Spirochaetia bacterium]|nr:HD domain-containing protein [Spirochaetia bacterium]
ESVTRDIISPVKQATDDLPNIVKKIENEIVSKELVPLMEDFIVKEVTYFTSDEFSNRIQDKSGRIQIVSYEELNEKYNNDEFKPVDGKLVRICDHLSALMEANISIKHGITSEHLEIGLETTVNHYEKNQVINGINVYEFFTRIIEP